MLPHLKNHPNVGLIEAEYACVKSLVAVLNDYKPEPRVSVARNQSSWNKLDVADYEPRQPRKISTFKPTPKPSNKPSAPKKIPRTEASAAPTPTNHNEISENKFDGSGYEKEHVELIMRDVLQISSTKWADVSGLEEAKSLLEEAIVLPLLMPDYFKGIRRPWR